MPKPKDIGRNPMRRGIKFVKKAGCWLYYENFNHENTPDKAEWFNTKEEAEKRYEEGGESNG